uniref:Uncharacterized protein n=1 Tax=Anguilla anguilla TaxID=7936 RepID=A0A0E9QTX7_ANGAN
MEFSIGRAVFRKRLWTA